MSRQPTTFIWQVFTRASNINSSKRNFLSIRQLLVLLSAGVIAALVWTFSIDGHVRFSLRQFLASNAPGHESLFSSPLVQNIQQRGYITIGVRTYRRPSPDPEARPQVDDYEMALAHYLAENLKVHLKTLEMSAGSDGLIQPPASSYDLALGITASGLPLARSTAPDTQVYGAITILPRPDQDYAGTSTRSVQLVGLDLCAMQGSPYAQSAERDYGSHVKYLPSTVAAISAFVANECDGVIADKALLDRLQRDESWAFYKQLPISIRPEFGNQASLASGEKADIEAFHFLLESWSHSEENQKRQRERMSLYLYETTQIQPGSFCH